MSLRAQLMISVAMVLLVCLAFGSGFVYWHAVNRVDTEIGAKQTVGGQTAENAVADERASRWNRW